MGWRISSRIAEILHKGGDGGGIGKEEARDLMRLDLHSREVYALMHTADSLSRAQFHGKAENHFHIGLNVEPCPYDCGFCSLAMHGGVFRERMEFDEGRVVRWAKEAESGGADALNIMTTGTYAFEKLLDFGLILKKEVSIPLVANTRDLDHKEGQELLDSGFTGAYHAVRLGEGKDTPFTFEKRVHTIQVLKDMGLLWMNCVEPVGPEHEVDEILHLMFLARTYGAVYSGVMRRINFPGSPMEKYGMISELEMARMVAVSRLVMGAIPMAHCTHEPNSVSLVAGANLFFPEVGASPRDARADTGSGRGRRIDHCRQIQAEMGWDAALPSNCFIRIPPDKRTDVL